MLANACSRLQRPPQQQQHRHRPPALLLLLSLVFLLTATVVVQPAQAVIYTTAISTANAPAEYGSSGTIAVEGLYLACRRATNASATNTNRMALTIRTEAMANMVSDAVGTGTYYIAGYFDATANGWFWSDGLSGTTTQFGVGPSSTPVNNLLGLNWATGYPKMESSTSNTVGSLKYMVYDGVRKGWVNVAGTATYDGAACESEDNLIDGKKKFPWWAILIIVIACVLVIVLVIVVVCCCCKKKKEVEEESSSDEDAEDGDEMTSRSFNGSRNASFNSRRPGRAGAKYAAPRSSGSFSSRGSSYSAASRKSGWTASTNNDSYSYSVSPTGSRSSGWSSSDSYSSDSDSSSSSSSDSR